MSDRTVSTDALATLGTIIDEHQKRDAIHLAVFPAVAGSNLAPGSHVKIDAEGLVVNAYGEGIGIADPFLPKEGVRPGQRFWVVIYPRQINSLRHVWSHQAFPDEPEVRNGGDDAKEMSRKWLQDFANRLFSYQPEDVTRFEMLMEGAEDGCFGSDIEYGEDLTPSDEFWGHFERYTGRKVTSRPEYFRCAC